MNGKHFIVLALFFIVLVAGELVGSCLMQRWLNQ